MHHPLWVSPGHKCPSVVVSLKVELTLQLLLEAPSTRLDQQNRKKCGSPNSW